MVRTVKDPQERRAELLSVASKLFGTKGYEATTVNDIIAETGIAKGTFYHYFKSKFEMLDELVTLRMAQVLEPIEVIRAKPDLDAISKINKTFDCIQQWKYMNRDLMLTAIEVMFREDNAVAHVKATRKMSELLKPVFADIIRQGVEEGVFQTPSPENTAEAMLAMFNGMREALIKDIIVAYHEAQGMNRLIEKMTVFENAVARVLGAPENSIEFIDRQLLRTFFDGMPHPKLNGVTAPEPEQEQ